jgi:pyruvate dehydrogenase E2 component (dihydrolipoamide acetyltransferase)
MAGQAVPVRGMRKVIAERMHASLQEMAQLTMAMEVTMDEAVKLRAALVAEWAPEGVKPSYTDLVIKAVAKALVLHPLLNATLRPGEIELLPQVHVGMAVALDEGLVVPVIRDADVLPLKDLAAASTRLADAARSGTLGLDDMAGATFSVTALGMAGVDFFTPIINPPNVAILGVGRIREGLAWDGDRPVKQHQMTLSLTIDHRAVDGAPGAAFLNTVRELLEAPYRLLV